MLFRRISVRRRYTVDVLLRVREDASLRSDPPHHYLIRVYEDSRIWHDPYLLVIIDSQSGLILASELLKPLPSLEHMRGTEHVSARGRGHLAHAGTIYAIIHIDRDNLTD